MIIYSIYTKAYTVDVTGLAKHRNHCKECPGGYYGISLLNGYKKHLDINHTKQLKKITQLSSVGIQEPQKAAIATSETWLAVLYGS